MSQLSAAGCVFEIAESNVVVLNSQVCADMQKAMMSAGSQHVDDVDDVSRRLYSHRQLDAVVDSARLFDRCALVLRRLLEYSDTKKWTLAITFLLIIYFSFFSFSFYSLVFLFFQFLIVGSVW